MRKETNSKKSNVRIYAISLIGVAVVLIIGMLYYNLSKPTSDINYTDKLAQMDIQTNNNSTNENRVEQASTNIGKTVEESKKEEKEPEKIAINTSIMENKMNNTNENKTNNIEGNKTNSISKNTEEEKVDNKEEGQEEKQELVFGMPVDGDILKEYGKDTLLYSATLNEWTTHLGIDIKAEKTTVVKASERGTVKSIKNDPRYGLTIVIEHTDGYSTVYANLLTSEFVVEGEQVEKGQTIGTVGNTAVFEIVDESHLHFEILKDNVQLDPSIYIK